LRFVLVFQVFGNQKCLTALPFGVDEYTRVESYCRPNARTKQFTYYGIIKSCQSSGRAGGFLKEINITQHHGHGSK